MHDYPLFAAKQTFVRIDFLRQGGRLVGKKGTHNVKIRAEKMTDLNWRVDKFGVTGWQVRVGELAGLG